MNKQQIIQALQDNGFPHVYERKGGYLRVQKSVAIRAHIILNNDQLIVKTTYPMIGNLAQIIATIALFIIFIFINHQGFLNDYEIQPFIPAVVLGQLFSYVYFLPRLNTFKKELEHILNTNSTTID